MYWVFLKPIKSSKKRTVEFYWSLSLKFDIIHRDLKVMEDMGSLSRYVKKNTNDKEGGADAHGAGGVQLADMGPVVKRLNVGFEF